MIASGRVPKTESTLIIELTYVTPPQPALPPVHPTTLALARLCPCRPISPMPRSQFVPGHSPQPHSSPGSPSPNAQHQPRVGHQAQELGQSRASLSTSSMTPSPVRSKSRPHTAKESPSPTSHPQMCPAAAYEPQQESPPPAGPGSGTKERPLPGRQSPRWLRPSSLGAGDDTSHTRWSPVPPPEEP